MTTAITITRAGPNDHVQVQGTSVSIKGSGYGPRTAMAVMTGALMPVWLGAIVPPGYDDPGIHGILIGSYHYERAFPVVICNVCSALVPTERTEGHTRYHVETP